MIIPLFDDDNGKKKRIGTAIVERPDEHSDFEVVLDLNDPFRVNDSDNSNLIRDLKNIARRDEKKRGLEG